MCASSSRTWPTCWAWREPDDPQRALNKARPSLKLKRPTPMPLTLMATIFVLMTAMCGAAYWWLDRKMQRLSDTLRDTYKLGLMIIYGFQMVLLLMFSL